MKNYIALSADFAGSGALLAESGLSLFITCGEESFLFDTGCGPLFSDNAGLLELPLERIGFAVLSHAHPNHIGGVPALSQLFSMISMSCPVYHTEDIVSPRLPALAFRAASVSTRLSTEAALICTESKWEKENVREISLLADKTLFIGCAHSGITDIADEALKFGKVSEIAGGFHNFEATSEECRKTAAALYEKGIRSINFLHCSDPLKARFFEDAGISCRIGRCGQKFDFFE